MTPPEDSLPGIEIPVLRDVVAGPQDSHAAPAALRELAALDADARAALVAESRYLLDELLDEMLPFLEARLRERLEQRIRELLGEAR